MPGKFIDTVHIYQCGTHSDGTAIMCSEVLFGRDKIPFILPGDSPNEVGWQEAGKNDVHIPLTSMVESMKKCGINISYNEAELERIWGPRPELAAD